MSINNIENKELIEEVKRRIKSGVIEIETECGQLCEEVFFLRDKGTDFILEISSMYDHCKCSRCKRFVYDQHEQDRAWLLNEEEFKKKFVCRNCETEEEKSKRDEEEKKIIERNKKFIEALEKDNIK